MKPTDNLLRCETEPLESRIMLDGNLTIVANNGNITVTGDDLGNQLLIDLNPQGFLQFTGQNGTTINDTPFPHIFGATVNGLSGNLRLNMRDGNDLVTGVGAIKVNGQFVFTGGNGNDTIIFSSLQIGGNFVVNSGAHSDDIELLQTVVGGTSRIITGSGDDVIDVELDSQRAITVTTATGNDQVTFRQNASIVAGNLTINTAAGNDKIRLHGPDLANGNLIVNSGAGDDVVGVLCVANIAGNARILTGAGLDLVSVVGANVLTDLRIITGSGNDGVFASGSAQDDFIINTGSGDDSIVGVALVDQLLINTGSGNDSIGFTPVALGSSRIIMGAGMDRLTIGPGSVLAAGIVNGGPGQDDLHVDITGTFFGMNTVSVETIVNPSASAVARITTLFGIYQSQWVSQGGATGDFVCL